VSLIASHFSQTQAENNKVEPSGILDLPSQPPPLCQTVQSQAEDDDKSEPEIVLKPAVEIALAANVISLLCVITCLRLFKRRLRTTKLNPMESWIFQINHIFKFRLRMMRSPNLKFSWKCQTRFLLTKM
jgi:hypothetical protein